MIGHPDGDSARRNEPLVDFLTFSNGAVGNGRKWTGSDGSRSGEKALQNNTNRYRTGLSGTPEHWFESRWGYKFSLFYKAFRVLRLLFLTFV
jgi:hypothetical protein